MKMKRPFALDITLFRSDSSGQGAERYHRRATGWNSLWAKVRRSLLASLSVAKSYRKYDDRVSVSKKCWISASGLLVMIIFSHEARVAAPVRSLKMAWRLR